MAVEKFAREVALKRAILILFAEKIYSESEYFKLSAKKQGRKICCSNTLSFCYTSLFCMRLVSQKIFTSYIRACHTTSSFVCNLRGGLKSCTILRQIATKCQQINMATKLRKKKAVTVLVFLELNEEWEKKKRSRKVWVRLWIA